MVRNCDKSQETECVGVGVGWEGSVDVEGVEWETLDNLVLSVLDIQLRLDAPDAAHVDVTSSVTAFVVDHFGATHGCAWLCGVVLRGGMHGMAPCHNITFDASHSFLWHFVPLSTTPRHIGLL